MQLLKKRILQDGKCYEGGILKVPCPDEINRS